VLSPQKYTAITQKHFPSPPTDAWARAAEKLGYPKIEDASDPTTVYASFPSFLSSPLHFFSLISIRYGSSDSWQTFVGSSGRRSDASAYINILDKKGKVCWNQPRSKCNLNQNLIIWTETHVTKVLINENKRAYGVEYAEGVGLDRTDHPTKPRSEDEAKKHHSPFNKWNKKDQKGAERLGAPVDYDLAYDWSRPYEQFIPESTTNYVPKTVTAKYEVIMAAGAIVTAQLLMLSGIGPKDHLREQGITLVQDLPVGTHTNDHQEVFIEWLFSNKYKPNFSFVTELLKGFPELRKYQNRQRSFYSSSQFAGGLDGSSDGPTGTIPKWHMHHLVGGAFENLDWNIASYEETVDTPYRVPRGVGEILLWQGLKMHSHGC
jgi:hypothetical protein